MNEETAFYESPESTDKKALRTQIYLFNHVLEFKKEWKTKI